MSRSSQATNSLDVGESESTDVPHAITECDDQCFLLHFIISIYFGPDLKGEKTKKSFLQRYTEHLPPYTSDQLSGSRIKVKEMQKIYYHVMRKAEKSVVAGIRFFRQFFQDSRSNLGQGHRFTDLFPLKLHPHSPFRNQHHYVENIVFVNNEEPTCIRREDIERFKRLTGLDYFLLDMDAARLHSVTENEDEEPSVRWHSTRSSNSSKRSKCTTDIVLSKTKELDITSSLSRSSEGTRGNDGLLDFSHDSDPSPSVESKSDEDSGPTIIFHPSKPSGEEWDHVLAATKTGFALTGTAAMGQLRPPIGLLDIGEREDSYFFRIALPGVKNDERKFSCEVDTDGVVLIRGMTTTGERSVTRCSHVFRMQTQNLCPPGLFSISFRLPGPINPQRFSGNFGQDGILEAVVTKARRAR